MNVCNTCKYHSYFLVLYYRKFITAITWQSVLLCHQHGKYDLAQEERYTPSGFNYVDKKESEYHWSHWTNWVSMIK